MSNLDNDFWGDPDEPLRFRSYLENTYGGAPNECSWHFRQGQILQFDDKGECPKSDEHPDRWY